MIENQKDKPEGRKVKIIDFIYSINEEEKTAGIFSYENINNDIIIQRSITYNSKTYIITSILEGVFQNTYKIKSISFADDSELRIIEKDAISCSLIQSISLPSSLVELKDEWCNMTPNLNQISISSDNPYYKTYEDKFIIGKSTNQQENFDVLVFCVRNIQNVKIPDFIKIIGQYAFNCCYRIQKPEISNESKLQIIEKDAFSYSSVYRFTIPSKITKIGGNAFSSCEQLQYVDIPLDSKLRIIEENTFSETSIQSFIIPNHITTIEKNAFAYCHQLQIIEIPSNPNIKDINKKIFNDCKNVIIMTSSKLLQ